MRVKKDSVGNPAKCEAYYQIQSRILKESMDTKKGTFSAEKSAFRAEKLAFLVEKSAFRARKIVFSDWKAEFSAETVPFPPTHIFLEFQSR